MDKDVEGSIHGLFQVLSQYLPVGTGGNHETHQSL